MIEIAGNSFESNVATVVCVHLFEKRKPRLVSFELEGDLIFSCGCDDHDAADDWKLVSLSTVVEAHPELNMLPSMDWGTQAERLNDEADWIVASLSNDN